MLRLGKVWLVLAFSVLAVAACSSDEGKRTARDDAGGEGGSGLGEGGSGLGEGGSGLGGDGSGLGGVGSGLGGVGSGLGGVGSGLGGDAAGAGDQTATLFISDSANGVVYRYNVTPSSDPVLTATISAPPAAWDMAVSAAGELFVGQDTDAGEVLRFKSILATPTPNGVFSNANGHYLAGLTFVDDELWTMSSAYRACSADPAGIVRYSFDAAGMASPMGTVTTGLIGANRGILWDPTNRMLFVTQCESFQAIQRYQVAADHTVTALAPVEGAPLNSPHQLVMTSWRELIVTNAGTAAVPGMSLLRLKVDAQGGLTPNGTIDGNGLNVPVGVALAPWGELFAVSNATAVISRFTFDAAHVATAHGTFQMTAPTMVQSFGVGSAVFVPGSSTNLIGAGGAGGG